jgi:hypothetical protein
MLTPAPSRPFAESSPPSAATSPASPASPGRTTATPTTPMGEARRRAPHLGWLCTRAEVALDRWQAACDRASDLLSDRSEVC